ncbi:MAG: site-2 protease family protein [Deltaproteobacteria bacterium]|nr:site-2 protease family protein [Deltaproteobacteria bacterium]
MRDLSAVQILLAILALGFLIVVHEAGHYFVALWCKMRVERFSIGFGPGILKHRAKNGTIFQLAPIPFGGFVEIKGMNIAEEVSPDDAHAYPNRPTWQRFLTILAGPATNYLAAFVLAFFLFKCAGVPGSTTYIDQIVEGSASEGILFSGDRIVEIDGVAMSSPNTEKLSAAVNAKAGKPLAIVVDRSGARVPVTVTPRLVHIKANGDKCEAGSEGCKTLYQIGVQQAADKVDVGVVRAAELAVRLPIDVTGNILAGFRDIFTGREKPDLGGPVRILGEFKKAFEVGWTRGIELVIMLSVYLGLFNLFPIPALDGGRLVFLGYEMVTRRRPNPKIEMTVTMVGVLLLVVLALMATVFDIRRYI